MGAYRYCLCAEPASLGGRYHKQRISLDYKLLPGCIAVEHHDAVLHLFDCLFDHRFGAADAVYLCNPALQNGRSHGDRPFKVFVWVLLRVPKRVEGGKARLEKMAQQRGLRNMQFFPLQSYDALPALLKMGDCHLVVQKRGAADAVLPSKLTNILAVGGNAVITAEAHTELGQLCETFPGIAVCVEPESVEALVAGIRQALLLPKHNTVAREYAERTLDKENVLRQFINDIRG